jgi:putative spermidine/putrescine transport system substrate-binding protein
MKSRVKLQTMTQTLAVIAVLLVAACSPTATPAQPGTEGQATQPPAGQRTQLVVAGFGGLWEESFNAAVARPFEALHPNVEIVHVISGPIAETVAKLRAERNNPTLDVVGTGVGFERVMADEGLLAEFDPALMPNLANVFPHAIYDNKVVANSFAGVGLAYHTERVPRVPTSWYDLWDPAFQPVAIGDIVNTYGFTLLAFINELEGGTEQNEEPGWAKMAELIETQQPILAVSTDDTINAIVQRGAALSVVPNSRAIQLIREGYPLGFVYPEEGGMTWGTFMGVVNGSPDTQVAMEFINFWLDPQVQADFAARVNYGPANMLAEMPADYCCSDLLILGDTMDQAKVLNWTYLSASVPAWTERWNTEIVPLLR